MKHLHPALLAVAAAALALGGCRTTSILSADGMKNPRGVALVCFEDGGVKPAATCSKSTNVRAFVTGGSLGSVSIARHDGSKWAWVDNDPSVPGFTPLMIGDLPTRIVADVAQPQWLYMTLALGQELVRIQADKPTEGITRVPLPFHPDALVSVASPQRRLYLADTAGGKLWRLDAADLSVAPVPIAIGGSPRAMALVSQTGELYVAHRDHAHVTVLDLASETVKVRLSLGPACSDGIDNDGDGTTDAADSGCDDAADRFEGDPEVGAACTDGQDNDGDGQTDAADPGCEVSATVDACRDGVDNDGDGKTDFPDDPGCMGFGGGSEAWDAAACGDGVDNDGDGKTDTDDSDCTDKTSDAELGALSQGVKSACNDGLDNDGDGKTDTDDSDCTDKTSDAEQRPPCADGVDNDGDGLTDLDDPACVNRTSPGEVSADASPMSVIAATTSGEFVVVGHRTREALYVIDTKTRALVSDPARYERPSKLAANEGTLGIDLGRPPQAIAPISLGGFDALAVTTQRGTKGGEPAGMLYLRFRRKEPVEPAQTDAEGDPITETVEGIGLLPTTNESRSKVVTHALTVEDTAVDLGIKPPERHANFGTLNSEQLEDGRIRDKGLILSADEVEHRSEVWRMRAQGRIPGTARSTGQLLETGALSDPTADYCALGVVPGDLLLIHRGADAADCGGLTGATLAYRITDVAPNRLAFADGVVDQPVTLANQLDPPAPEAAPLPPLGCLPRRAIRYEVRASGWLVSGSRTGLLSRRGRQGAVCAPWDNNDPSQASRMVDPTLIAGADTTSLTCPLSFDNAELLEATPYGGGAAMAVAPFANLIWQATLLPGCAPSELPDAAPALLRPVRDTTWTYGVARGFVPVRAGVGANPVALGTAPGVGVIWVVDQGAGIMHTVAAGGSLTAASLD